MPKRTENKYSKKYMYKNIQSNAIINSQKVETDQMSFNNWMNEDTNCGIYMQ